jgi:D-arabinose 1-dehydrogenase-like Zn-dependent alcohol dehydrogenase
LIQAIELHRLEDVNDVLQGLCKGHIHGRVVLDISTP